MADITPEQRRRIHEEEKRKIEAAVKVPDQPSSSRDHVTALRDASRILNAPASAFAASGLLAVKADLEIARVAAELKSRGVRYCIVGTSRFDHAIVSLERLEKFIEFTPHRSVGQIAVPVPTVSSDAPAYVAAEILRDAEFAVIAAEGDNPPSILTCESMAPRSGHRGDESLSWRERHRRHAALPR
jgi:hypothetical protein